MLNKFRLGNPMQYIEYINILRQINRLYNKNGTISEKAFDFPYTLIGEFSDVNEEEHERTVHDMLCAVINGEYPINGSDEAPIEITVPLL